LTGLIAQGTVDENKSAFIALHYHQANGTTADESSGLVRTAEIKQNGMLGYGITSAILVSPSFRFGGEMFVQLNTAELSISIFSHDQTDRWGRLVIYSSVPPEMQLQCNARNRYFYITILRIRLWCYIYNLQGKVGHGSQAGIPTLEGFF